MKLNTVSRIHSLGLLAMLSMGAFVPATSAVGSEIVDWIQDGSLIFNERLRFEVADQANLEDTGEAFTLRSRIGWKTAALNGYTALVDFENVTALNSQSDYGLPGDVRNTGVIADPEVTEVNQYYISYEDESIGYAVGRQRWILDDARFVGNVGWRQNEQTFDAATFAFSPNEETKVQLGYIDNVNRILGNDGTAAALANLESNSFIVNAKYEYSPEFVVTGFAYLLDFENAAALSSDTFGFRATGTVVSGEDLKFAYALSYALQSDNSGSGSASYDVDFINAEVKSIFGNGYSVTAGFESQTSDGGLFSFKTPLATLHKFNGWADVFLATPAAGLNDLYIGFAGKLGLVPFAVTYHDFESDFGNTNFGSEVDLLFSYKLSENLNSVLKFASFDGDALPDVDKVSLQFDFSL